MPACAMPATPPSSRMSYLCRIRTREACRPASATPPPPSLLACAMRCASAPSRLLERNLGPHLRHLGPPLRRLRRFILRRLRSHSHTAVDTDESCFPSWLRQSLPSPKRSACPGSSMGLRRSTCGGLTCTRAGSTTTAP
eukprot:scaffold78734_cov69-Phaeocystis_antarctica.AAC.6